MWKTVLPDYNTYGEPLELRSLKRQLANLKCKCKRCDRNNELMNYRHVEEQKNPEIIAKDREIQAKDREMKCRYVKEQNDPEIIAKDREIQAKDREMKCRHVEEQKDPEIIAKDREIQAKDREMKCRYVEEQKDPEIKAKDREIQAKPSKCFLDRFVQTTVFPNFVSNINGKPHSYFPDQISDDIPCPSCYITLNLLRYGFTKVIKDAEIETKPDMFSCDKSTENTINCLEKTTSLTNRPMLGYSRLSFNDDITEQTSQSTAFSSKKSSHREVTFLLDGEYRSPEDTVSEKFSFNALVGNCVCIHNYIDSIRPPWPDQ